MERKEFQNMRLCAFADEASAALSGQIAALKRNGITQLEIRGVNGKNIKDLSTEEVKAVKTALDEAGISVWSIGSPIGKISLKDDFEAHIEDFKRILAAADILGARRIRMFSFFPAEGMSDEEIQAAVYERIATLISLTPKYITLCHENEAKIYGDTPERCRDLLDYFGGELKCVFDMGNFVLENVEPYAAYELLKKDIAYFHIKDALSAGAIVPPGKGEAKIAEILSAHRKYAAGDFFVSLEPHLQLFSGLNALVGRAFENPYQYTDAKSAFADAVEKFKELI